MQAFLILNMLQYIDAHCHLSETPADINVGAIYNAARQSDWMNIIAITDVQKNIFGAIGVHPWYVSDIPVIGNLNYINCCVKIPNYWLVKLDLISISLILKRKHVYFVRRCCWRMN